MPWYLDQISKCTYRQFTTGFYFGKPSDEAQIYDNNTYVNEYIYLGIVSEIDDRGYAKFEQRNKFCTGDVIEIMKPDKQTLFVKLSETPEKYDILRVKSKEAPLEDDVPDCCM